MIFHYHFFVALSLKTIITISPKLETVKIATLIILNSLQIVSNCINFTYAKIQN